MLDRVISYWRARKAQRKAEDFDRGYGVVMTDYFKDHTSLTDIRLKIDAIADWGQPMTEMEAGMIAAWRRLCQLEEAIDYANEVIEKVPHLQKPGEEIFTRYGRTWRSKIKDIHQYLKGQLNDH